jgi:hypothetical protein
VDDLATFEEGVARFGLSSPEAIVELLPSRPAFVRLTVVLDYYYYYYSSIFLVFDRTAPVLLSPTGKKCVRE